MFYERDSQHLLNEVLKEVWLYSSKA